MNHDLDEDLLRVRIFQLISLHLKPFTTSARMAGDLNAVIAAVRDADAPPPYPQGNVNGPCVCGGWPGGPCLRCLWIPRSKANEVPI